ncbi:MAG TPA: phage major capsid protein [Desulfosporosinus sp.]|nr:phage major capsid protein [Desulfosporosinus sp.]
MKKLIAEIRKLEARSAAINIKISAAKSVEEIRALQPEVDEIVDDLQLKRNKLYAMQGTESEPEFRGEPHTTAQRSQPTGAFNVIGSYGIGAAGGQQQRSEEIMPDKNDLYATPEYRSAFFKTLLGKDLTNEESESYSRAMDLTKAERRDTFSTTTSAAAVLPTTTLNQIIVKARNLGGIISHCRDFAIPTNLTVPIATPSTKAAWHVEGAPVAAEDATTGISNVSFAAYEILKVFSLSAAAKTMTISAFEAYIIDELTASVMETIADSLVNGTGDAQGTGVMTITWNAGNSSTFAIGGSVSHEDLTKLVAKLKSGYGNGAKWAMNNTTLYNQMYGMTDANGRPIYIADPKNEVIGFILGKPIVIDDGLADDVVILGNFKYMGYNIPQGVMIEVSRESSFRSGLIDYRAMAIADTKPLVDEAFVKLSRALI